MIQLYKIQRAIKFATKTHEIYQKQKRKGKDIPYITHPLTVGIILSRIGASDDVICAGILHDTIEDSIQEKKVTFEMLKERFEEKVAQLVLDVTEVDKTLPWEERKRLAIEHVASFSHDSLLVKSADLISNLTELSEDYDKDGEQVFARFNAPKNKLIINYLETITAIIKCWEENPLTNELRFLADRLQMMGAKEFMPTHPAEIIEYADYDKDAMVECPVCRWKGRTDGNIEYYDDLLDVSCPNCGKMILIVNYPLV